MGGRCYFHEYEGVLAAPEVCAIKPRELSLGMMKLRLIIVFSGLIALPGLTPASAQGPFVLDPAKLKLPFWRFLDYVRSSRQQ